MVEQTRPPVPARGLHKAIPLERIFAARQRTAEITLHTPLVRLNLDDAPAEIYLKLETLQPVGSFKLRGAASAMTALDDSTLKAGVWTASAGNMGYAVAWCARRLGAPCAVVAPEDAPAAKLQAIAAQGATIHLVPFAAYQEIQRRCSPNGLVEPMLEAKLTAMTLIHPFADEQVMAGNAVIGLEILEDLPQVEAVIAPYGGGGLSCGIASALRALRPQIRIYACEVETAAPLAASLAASQPVEIAYAPSFVSGMGAPFVFPQMWPLASHLLDDSLVVSLAAVRRAIRLLALHNHVIAEGAGAVSVAAAMNGMVGAGKIICIVSGGNMDASLLVNILSKGIQ
jgi:threonine dehydratase